MVAVCAICEGSGLRVVERDGRRFAEECVCRVEQRAARRLKGAAIPRRYEHCTLDSYETGFSSSHRSQVAALVRARRFVESLWWETYGRGMLLSGGNGVGK